MDQSLGTWMPAGLVEALAASPYAAVAVPALILILTVSIVTLSIPGALTPTAFLSGILLGMGGILVVMLGALLGSHLLFAVSRHWLGGFMQRRFGARIDTVGGHISRRGPAYIATARLFGVPHVIVTAACAAAPITDRQFLGASMVGLLPAITLAAGAGSGLMLL